MEEQVDELSKEVIALRREILIMKALLKQQNSLLKDLEQAKPKASPTITEPYNHLTPARFPIKTQADLDELEASINETNEPHIAQEVRYLVGTQGLAKNTSRILSMEIVLNYNLTGLHNKRRLQDYPKLLELLFKASIYSDDYTKFIEDLRLGLRYVKSRHFRNVSVQRRKDYESSIKNGDPLLVKKFKKNNDD